MKKLLFILLIITPYLSVLSQGFEGGHMDPYFSRLVKTHNQADLSGKIISTTDYPSGSLLRGPAMTTEQGIALALILIQDPSDMKLLKTGQINAIVINDGLIFIAYLNGTWEIQFWDKSNYPKFITRDGAQMYTISDKY